MACDASAKKPIREVKYHLDQLPEQYAKKVTIPCVGLDLGSHHVRVAVIDQAGQKVSVDLATFAGNDLGAALHRAKQQLANEEVSVYFTGHVTDNTEALIKCAFPKAKEVVRRDKLDSHNSGAHFLVSSLPDEELFYDFAEMEKKQQKPDMSLSPELMAAMVPPKMLPMMEMFMKEIMGASAQKFPFTLSIVGANNIICQVEEKGEYKAVEARCVGGHSMNTIWNAIGHPGHTGNYDHLMELASKGSRRKIDSLTSEILDFVGFYSIMPRDFPVFTFGKMQHLKREDVTPEDLARATVAMTSDMLFNKALDYSKMLRSYKIYFTGSLAQHESVRTEIFERCFSWGAMGMIKPKFFKIDATAALGACLGTA